jgi:hypothetical protein
VARRPLSQRKLEIDPRRHMRRPDVAIASPSVVDPSTAISH